LDKSRVDSKAEIGTLSTGVRGESRNFGRGEGGLVEGTNLLDGQHAKHAAARGSEGMPPSGKFLKVDAKILKVRAISTYIKCFYSATLCCYSM